MSKPSCVIIGIAGASASGKSLIAHTIYQRLLRDFSEHDVGIIAEDSYYRDQSHLPMEERVKTNYDHPASKDFDLLLQHLRALKAGETIEIPRYSYELHTRTAQVELFSPKKVVILEGILTLTDARVRDELEGSVFVDTPLDICLTRRLRRDVIERGRTMESVLDQYKATVRPMYLQFIEPSKQYADIIVPRGGKNKAAIDILTTRIKHLIRKAQLAE